MARDCAARSQHWQHERTFPQDRDRICLWQIKPPLDLLMSWAGWQSHISPHEENQSPVLRQWHQPRGSGSSPCPLALQCCSLLTFALSKLIWGCQNVSHWWFSYCRWLWFLCLFANVIFVNGVKTLESFKRDLWNVIANLFSHQHWSWKGLAMCSFNSLIM